MVDQAPDPGNEWEAQTMADGTRAAAGAGGQADDESAGGVGRRLLDLVFQALPAIGGAVGFVGFVAVLGAAIDWTRFAAAGLPADQAVRVIDRSELVATGAVSLVFFTLLGLIAVLVAYLLDPQAKAASPRLRRGAAAVTIVELLVVLWFTPASWWVYVLVGLGGIAFAALADVLFRAFGAWRQATVGRQRLADELTTARRELRDAQVARDAAFRSELTGDIRAAEHRRADAVAQLASLLIDNAERLALGPDVGYAMVELHPADLDQMAGRGLQHLAAEQAQQRSPWSSEVVGAGSLAVTLAALALVLVLTIDDARWIGIMVLVVVLLNGAVYGVARASHRFLWYGIAIFVSVPLFGAALGAARTYRFPKLQPVALIRTSSDEAICGIYVAENDKRVYIARVELANPGDRRAKAGTGRLFWVPLSDVDMIKVGPAQSISDANGRAPLLADELYADRAEQAPATLAATRTTTSTDRRDGVRTQTVSETAAEAGRPTPRTTPANPTGSCTHQSLQTPLEAARPGWVAPPADEVASTP